jgi:hypothetical protein
MLTMNDMLSKALQDFLGLLQQLIRNLLGKDSEEWTTAFKKFLRKEPTWAEEMMYIPLEWSPDLGNVSKKCLQDHIDLYRKENGPCWRLPTYSELRRALSKTPPKGFSIMRYYWTSTLDEGKDGIFSVLRTHDGCGGLGQSSDHYFPSGMKGPNLRLVRVVSIS